jgi:calpain-15
VREIKLRFGGKARICLVRNPWGKKEWTGDWSDSSPLWNNYTKSQVPEFKLADDGCFWISFNDYDKFFYITTICFYKTGYHENYICDELEEGEFGLCKLTLTEDS